MSNFVNINEGVKHDQEKPRMDLLPPFPLVQIAIVLGHGAKKYDAHNWRKGMDFSRPYAAALRHMFAWNDGEDIDPESGLNHIDHALCELLFLRQYIKDFPERDDRFKAKPTPAVWEFPTAAKCSYCDGSGFVEIPYNFGRKKLRCPGCNPIELSKGEPKSWSGKRNRADDYDDYVRGCR